MAAATPSHTAPSQPTVAIVDNDRFTRRALRDLIEQDGRYRILWDRASGQAAIELTRATETRPDILLLDMSLGDTTGIHVCQVIRHDLANIRILGITAFPPQTYAADLARAGAQGLVTKDADAELMAGIRAVLGGSTYCPAVPSVTFSTAIDAFHAAQMNMNGDPYALTSREAALLESYAHTNSYKITARELNITESTARNTMVRIKHKLGVISTAEAIIAWREHNRDQGRNNERL